MRLKERNSGITVAHIRTWALVCLAVGIAGVTIIQRGILGIHQDMDQTTMTALFQQETSRHYLVVAMICMGVYTCAVPLFGLLLVEGSLHTKDFSAYLIRTLAVAVVSEVPFDYATRGVWLDISTLNPAFGLVAALVMLMFFRRYCDNSAGSIILRCIITAAVVLWTIMLPMEEGPCIVLLTSVLWNFREKPVLRTILGCVAGVACSAFAFYYVATPIAMIVVHFYNGEKGSDFKWGRLVAYPAILVVAAAAYMLVF